MSITGTRSQALRAVAKFVKKPDSAKAAEYIKAGYFWNSGNFMFRAATLRDEYGKFDATSVQAVTSSAARAGRDLGFVTLDPDAFGAGLVLAMMNELGLQGMEEAFHRGIVVAVGFAAH